jgi:PEP-CTERM motif
MKSRRLHKNQAIRVRKGMRSFSKTGLPLVGTVAALWLVGGPASASITYKVYDLIGQGNVQGTITTDGTLGVLSVGDITGWDLILNGVGASFTLSKNTPSVQNNSGVLLSGADLTATPSDLMFNYSGKDNGVFAFQTTFYSGYHYWCNAASAGICYQGATVSPQSIFDASAQHVGTSGAATIALGNGVNYFPDLGNLPADATEVDDGIYTEPVGDDESVTFGVAKEPPSASYSKGLFHYTYELGYVGPQTLVLPLISPGDVVGLTGGCDMASPSFAGGETLQQVFGTQYSGAISCALPASDSTTAHVFDFSFDSVYAPTEVTMGLVDQDGVVSYVDPPAPNSSAIPEPSTWALMLIGFGWLGFAAYHKRRPAISIA